MKASGLWTAIADDLVPFVLALAVVLGWLYLAAMANPAASDFRDAALGILFFYFGGKTTRNGVTAGGNAAHGPAPVAPLPSPGTGDAPPPQVPPAP